MVRYDMKFENEITVKVLTSFEELTSILVNQGFSIKNVDSACLFENIVVFL